MARYLIFSAYDGERHYPALKGEETGMVYCPMKMSGMAIMACAAWQKNAQQSAISSQPCPCPNRATREQIWAALEAQKLSLREPRHKGEKDPHLCPHCGGWKSDYTKTCIRCRGRFGGARKPYRRKARRGADIVIGDGRTVRPRVER